MAEICFGHLGRSSPIYQEHSCSPCNPIGDFGFEGEKRVAMVFAEIEYFNDGFQGKELLEISAAVFLQRRHSEHVGHVKEIQYGLDLL